MNNEVLTPNSPPPSPSPLVGEGEGGGLTDFFDLGDDLFGLEVPQTDGT